MLCAKLFKRSVLSVGHDRIRASALVALMVAFSGCTWGVVTDNGEAVVGTVLYENCYGDSWETELMSGTYGFNPFDADSPEIHGENFIPLGYYRVSAVREGGEVVPAMVIDHTYPEVCRIMVNGAETDVPCSRVDLDLSAEVPPEVADFENECVRRGLVNACDEGPCLNGGECQRQGKGFTCECADGFSGVTCEVCDAGVSVETTYRVDFAGSVTRDSTFCGTREAGIITSDFTGYFEFTHDGSDGPSDGAGYQKVIFASITATDGSWMFNYRGTSRFDFEFRDGELIRYALGIPTWSDYSVLVSDYLADDCSGCNRTIHHVSPSCGSNIGTNGTTEISVIATEEFCPIVITCADEPCREGDTCVDESDGYSCLNENACQGPECLTCSLGENGTAVQRGEVTNGYSEGFWLGIEFVANEDFSITHLGAFNFVGELVEFECYEPNPDDCVTVVDGMASKVDVGLYDSETLLASAAVQPADPLIDGHRYATIEPVVLEAGKTYSLIAVINDGDYFGHSDVAPQYSSLITVTDVISRNTNNPNASLTSEPIDNRNNWSDAYAAVNFLSCP
jgi:hypothetical protein